MSTVITCVPLLCTLLANRPPLGMSRHPRKVLTQSIESKDEKYGKYRSSPWWTLRESFVFGLVWLHLPTLVTFWLPPTPTSSRLPPAVLVPFWQTTLPQRVTSFMDIPSIWHTEHSTQTYNIRSYIYSSPAKIINDLKWRSWQLKFPAQIPAATAPARCHYCFAT